MTLTTKISTFPRTHLNQEISNHQQKAETALRQGPINNAWPFDHKGTIEALTAVVFPAVFLSAFLRLKEKNLFKE